MLSKRLRTIADLIIPGSVVFDVGSDHALLPCYLAQKGLIKRAYAGDNKPGPLQSAINNINRLKLNDLVIPLLSEGLEKVTPDVDTVVIAGMGVNTAIEILQNADLKQFKRIIVQLNRNTDQFRSYLSDSNYSIIDETIIYDGFYYPIIVFNTIYHERYTAKEIALGPILLKKREPSFYDYLQQMADKLAEIELKAKKDDDRSKLLIMIKEELAKK